MAQSKDQSEEAKVEGRVVLIQQGDELAEFRDLLTELTIPFELHDGPLPRPGEVSGASLIVVPAGRLMDGGTPNLSLWPRTIAVVDDSSKTLLSHLSRVGAAMVVHRPIHPRTLRLLLLHEIYRGPERRNQKRVLIGHPVRIVAGLFKQRATLCELSDTGARIELPGTPKIGSKVRILIGKDLTGTKPLKLHAVVMRCIRPSGEDGRESSEVGVQLIKPGRNRVAIAEVLRRFASGPSAWKDQTDSATGSFSLGGTTTDQQDGETPPAPPAAPEMDAAESLTLESAKSPGEAEPAVRRLPPSRQPSQRTERPAYVSKAVARPQAQPDEPFVGESPVVVPADVAEELHVDPVLEADPDRRGESRVTYSRRVVALGEEAARVLIGRDLSTGGMRIQPNPAVTIGDDLRVALHCGTNLEPIVVRATAARDDGDDGILLTFDSLSDAQSSQIEKILESSESIQDFGEHEGGGSGDSCIVMGELLEEADSPVAEA